MKNRYAIRHNKGNVGNKIIYADYLEYREGNALFWQHNPPPDGKLLIGLFSLKQFHVVKEEE